MPWLPLADPDTWGYLNPALQRLAGEGLVQTHSRGMAYPLFLWSVLNLGKNFQNIAIVQHALGLLSGMVWVLAFRQWQRFLPENHANSPTLRWLAVLCLAAYLCNPATLAFESEIRPEGVFPFFSLSQIAITLLFLRARLEGRLTITLFLSASAAIFFAIVCLSLKPSWGMAALIPFVVVGWGILFNQPKLAVVARCGLAVVAVGAFALWNVLVPRLAQWKPEPNTGGHLAGTLFSIHANIISQEMHHRAERGKLDPEEEAFLAHLDQTLIESRKDAKRSWMRALGHDADYILYRSDLFWKPPHVSAEDGMGRNRFLRQAYLRAALAEPRLMASKVLWQLLLAYNDASISLFNRSVQWGALFGRTPTALNTTNFPRLPEELDASVHESLAQLATAQPPKHLVARLSPSRLVFRSVVTWYLMALVLASGALVAFFPWLGRFHSMMALRPAVGALAVIWTCSIGSALTVAIIHCFAIGRYLELQSSLHALLLATGTGLLMTMLARGLKAG